MRANAATNHHLTVKELLGLVAFFTLIVTGYLYFFLSHKDLQLQQLAIASKPVFHDTVELKQANEAVTRLEQKIESIQQHAGKKQASRKIDFGNARQELLKVTNILNRQPPRYEGGQKNDGPNSNYNNTFPHHLYKTRDLPDARNELCRKQRFDWDLPTACVIMPFRTEKLHILENSVKTLLERTPAHLLDRIVLVDDNNPENLTGHFENKFPKTVYIKNSKREGLIRSRMYGSYECDSPILVFFDCHIEANVGWYEPIAQTIKNDPTYIVVPEIDSISDKKPYAYVSSGSTVIGGFGWHLGFTWKYLSNEQSKNRSPTDLKISPAMPGGLFAASAKYWKIIGEFDREMDIWGAENVELSLRIWLCGGTLVVVPCSHVGHIFRSGGFPYDFPGGQAKSLDKNKMRIAEVWLDEYKEVYYSQYPHARKKSPGDITERLKLKKELGCKPFSWYLDNILPELYAALKDPNDPSKGVKPKKK